MYPLLGDVDSGEAVHVGGRARMGKSLYFPLKFAVNFKLLLKKLSYLQNKNKNMISAFVGTWRLQGGTPNRRKK